jgi:hypothetical protein
MLILIVKLPAYKAGFPEFNFSFIRYMPLDPAYKSGLARHETGQL